MLILNSLPISYFVEDARTEPWLQGLRRREVDRSAKDFRQPIAESREVVKVRQTVELDQDVDIAVGGRLVPCDRSENADTANARSRQLGKMRIDKGEKLLACHLRPRRHDNARAKRRREALETRIVGAALSALHCAHDRCRPPPVARVSLGRERQGRAVREFPKFPESIFPERRDVNSHKGLPADPVRFGKN